VRTVNMCLPEHDYGSAIVMIEIDAFGYFATSYRKKNGPAAVVTSLVNSDELILSLEEKGSLVDNFPKRCSSRLRQGFQRR
jgi:hypothetical protein